jgi:hypothetical protein
MDELTSRSSLTRITDVTIEKHEYIVPSVVKKNIVVAAMSMSSKEAFPTVRLALWLEVSTVTTSIHDSNVQHPMLQKS